MKKIAYIIVAALLFGPGLRAQQELTLDQAFSIAMQNNYDIKIETENFNVSKNEANYGNAGYLPDVTASGTYEHKLEETDSETDLGAATGDGSGTVTMGGSNVTTQTINAGVTLSYVLFEGMAKKYRYNNLLTNKTLSALELQSQIESSLIDVASAYLEVAENEAALELAKENIAISKERAQRSEINIQYGSESKLAFLQALTFLNNDSIEYRSAEVELRNAKRNLNHTLGRDPEEDVQINSNVVLLPQYNVDSLLLLAEENNTMIKLAETMLDQSNTNLSLARSEYSPTLSINSRYGYYRQDNEENLIVYQENLGFTGDVTLSIPLYAGNRRKTEVQTSKIRIQQDLQNIDKTSNDVKTELFNSYEHYNFFIKQLKIEEENFQLYEDNFEKATEDYNNGSVNSTEVRETQVNLIAAKDRINSLKYSIKLYEIILQQLAGQLVEPI